MELNELVKLVAKQGEAPTDTLIRVLDAYIREHPEQVNVVLSQEEMMDKIRQMELKMREKDAMIQRLIEDTQEQQESVKEPVMFQNQPIPDARPRVQHVQSQTINVQAQPKQMQQDYIAPKKVVSQQEVPISQTGFPIDAPAPHMVQNIQRAQGVQWAKSSNPMRQKIMEFMQQERDKELVLPNDSDD